MEWVEAIRTRPGFLFLKKQNEQRADGSEAGGHNETDN